MPLLLAFVSLALVLSVTGCDKDKDGDGTDEMTLEQLVDRGWESFESMDYTSSLRDFQAAIDLSNSYSDAWNGAGWSAGRLPGMLQEADDFFDHCLQIDANKWDALGGWAFISYQAGDWAGSIIKVDNLLQNKPGWHFLHQQSIDYYDLYIVKAQACYNLGDFQAAFDIVRLYLNKTFDTDITTPAGQRELLEEIERLREIYG